MMDRINRLCSANDLCREACSKFRENKKFSSEDSKELLPCLSELLLNPELTNTVAEIFPDILPQLMLLALRDSGKSSDPQDVSANSLHTRRCLMLGKLIAFHPDALKYALNYFHNHPAPYEDVTKEGDEPKTKKHKKSKFVGNEDIPAGQIATTCLQFLRAAPEEFRTLWNWSIFLDLYANHKDHYVRWLACNCVALVTGMCDAEKSNLISSKVSKEEAVSFIIQFHNQDLLDIGILGLEKDLALDESKRQETPSPTFDCAITIGGLVLPKYKNVPDSKSKLVLVESARTNLENVALGVAAGRAVCLQGPVGCGKTALVEHLATVTGRDGPPSFMKVQLGDQIDSKMLLGMYRCTDIPGEFVWQPGVLTQAVVGGHWLLLEDIDSCNTDVLALLSSLLENKQLSVPGYRDCVRAAPGFQLFLTQRLVCNGETLHRQHSTASSMLGKLWVQVQVEPLSRSELIKVIQEMYPNLTTLAPHLVDVFLLFSAGGHHSALTADSEAPEKKGELGRVSSKLISTRDLLKWCARTAEDYNPTSQECALKALQNAIDIFCWSLSDPYTRLNLAKRVAAVIGIIDTKASYFCDTHKPSVSASGPYLYVGRTKLKKLEEGIVTLDRKINSTFTFTRPASCILERVACCVANNEPVLLVGETGVGKTSSIQYLAQCMGQKLVVINMNQQSDSADLLGGYKPVELKYVIAPIREKFETLFRSLFDIEENSKFLGHIATCFSQSRWPVLISLMKHSCTAALKRVSDAPNATSQTKKGRKRDLESNENNKEDKSLESVRKKWVEMSEKVHHLECQLKNTESPVAFAFVEGSLVRALREGYWVLLDEINLATAETLQCLSGLLEGSSGSLSLLERGDRDALLRHSNFRLFAAMNPATNVGKKELPPGIRNRFTEFFVDELTDKQDLLLLCSKYLIPLALPASLLDSVVRFYVNIRKEANRTLVDGIGDRPHYSLRTFCRALQVAASNPCQAARRSLYEGLLLSFLTQLDGNSRPIVEKLLSSALIGKGGENAKNLLHCPLTDTKQTQKCVMIEGYPVVEGIEEPKVPEKYILTPTVRRNLKDLVRVVSLARLPILLQGETSVGKTSLIKYLAESSGNRCVRINNHEHTDLQEYIGCYAADEHGKLTFKEGVLVEAMRKGYWIILDELNLAPSDVLEALNRVLDDNRELFVTETQETIKAHPNFMLFGTQNPPGRYGGRKVLSRAFRNRFVEFHLEDIPQTELETILHQRCDMPLSYCKKLVAVMHELQRHRTNSAAFAGKEGFITLRDLFRWGERYRLAYYKQTSGKFYDWDQHIADEGFLLLAGRVRLEEERKVIIGILQKHLKRNVSTQKLFTLNEETSTVTRHILEHFLKTTPTGFQHIVWTSNLRQLAVLLGKACEFKEPVLLVGDTGCGKTTICQYLAASRGKTLDIVNCHMHSESADFLGGLRPVRDHSSNSQKLFEWVDGPLIRSMTTGGLFLADEISLAEDSVLERLNSLLEPERTILLAEKGTGADGHSEEIRAVEGFHFIGTMNPGGDYGKKELSPALRNRFTEIWCEPCLEREDLVAVVQHNLTSGLTFGETSIAPVLVDFLEWFSSTEMARKVAISMRDVLTWVNFINVSTRSGAGLSAEKAYIHGACLTFLDSFGSGLTSVLNSASLVELRSSVLRYLIGQIKSTTISVDAFEDLSGQTQIVAGKFGIQPFYVDMGKEAVPSSEDFHFSAPTTHSNLTRLLRGMQLAKALLLEGSPGVGKTSLVTALARASGHRLIRINLSDQTDVSDLFGADLPVEGGSGGEFAWRDGPFLQALRAGHWILLDELNLASQSVLEGLNAVLDHRGDLFIPELGQTFHIRPGQTRIFGCQNPLSQGGARKGLPKSFLNRFTQVFMDTLTDADLEFICASQFPQIPNEVITRMVEFNGRVARETGPAGSWGSRGAPWEFNLRDITRWCQATLNESSNRQLNPGRFVQLIYVDRMRTLEDKENMKNLYEEVFGEEWPLSKDAPVLHVAPDKVFIGDVALSRIAEVGETCIGSSSALFVLQRQLPALHSIARCVSLNWMSILVGSSGCGKSSAVRLLAQLTGKELRTLSVNSAMDTTEILGGFEQVDYTRHLDEIASKLERLLLEAVRRLMLAKRENDVKKLLSLLAKSARETPEKGNPASKFELRTKILNEMLITIPEHVIPDPAVLSQLKSRLDTVTKNVLKDESLNAGGRFEWIDSVLVKSLVDGCWLLVDNVNLCSATVLDRLNGLLEPQGVLTIGERGVGVDGELVTITPHPDFRLFLTMDSRRGEISRAMRNRGVEIYLLDPNDVEGDLEPLDRAALLNFVGLKDAQQQLALVKVHEVMASSVTGPDTPGVTELLQAASLLAQAQQHGVHFRDAFLNACKSVYIRSRISDTPAARRELLAVLEEAFKCTGEVFKTDLTVVSKLCRFGRVNAADLWMDSVLAEMKQRSSVLLSFSQESRAELKKVDELLGCVSEDSLSDIRPQLMFVFYAMTSPAELLICHKWLAAMIENKTLVSLSSALSECLKAAALPGSNLPWDRRWVPDLVGENLGVNRIASIVLFTAMNTLEDIEKATLKSYSVMKYSEAVSKKTLTDDLTSEGVILELAPLLVEIDKTLWRLLKSKLEISDQQWWQLRAAFLWRHRLWKYANSTVLSSDSNSLEDVVRMTRVYVRWVLKRTVAPIREIAPSKDLKSLDKAVKNISSHVQYDGSSLNRLVKKMRTKGVYPLPYYSEQQVTSCEEASSLSQTLGLWEIGKSALTPEVLYKKLRTVLSPEGRQAWETLTDAYFLLSSNGDYAATKDHLDRAKKLVADVGASKSSEDPDSAMEKLDFNQVDQWPLLEFVTLRLGASLRAALSSKSANSEHIANNLLSMLLHLKTSPPALVGSVKYISQCDLSKEALLPWEAKNDLMLLLQHEASVPTLQCPYLWIGLSNDPVAIINSHQESDVPLEESLQLHCPVLSRCVGALLFSNNSDLSDPLVVIPLKDHERHRKKLSQIQSILWRNCGALSQPNFNYLKNEALCATHLLTDLVSRVEISLNIPPSEEPVKTRVDELCKRLISLDSSAEMKEFVSALLGASETVEQLSSGIEKSELIRFVGRAWVLVGALETRMFISLGFVDPAFKQVLKLTNIEEEISETQKELHAFTLTLKVKGLPTEENSAALHPHVAALYSNLKLLQEKRAKVLKGCVTPQRPEVSLFSLLSREIKNYGTSIGAFSTIHSLLNRVLLAHDESSGKIQEIDTLLLELNTWDQSQCRFQRILSERFAKWYPDMIHPLIAASVYLRHGMRLLKDSLFKAQNSSKMKDLDTTIRDLVQFPRASSSPLSVVHTLTSTSLARLLEMSGTEKEDVSLKPCTIEPKKELYRLLKSALMEVNNVVISSGTLGAHSSEEWKLLQAILQQFVSIWQKQEEERKIKELQEESLYKSSGALRGNTLTEEEEIAEGLAENFPSQREEDFGDIEAMATLEDDNPVTLKTSKELTGMLTKEDAARLCELHTSLVLRYTDSLWMRASKGGSVDLITPWLERSSTAARLLNVTCRSMDDSTDDELCASLALAAAAVLDAQRSTESQRITCKSKSGEYDFYHDACVDEVQQCAVVLQQVEERVAELRAEWPEHPTLKTILVVAERIKAFPLSSPVSRFLTGLEILLGKLQEWEENAHKGVSLGVYSKAVTELIFQWRRLELTCWKGCLDATARRIQNSASRWWFHLYSLVDGYVSGSISTPRDLLTSLERFMEEAPLGEFHSRLRLLFAFHCHSLHLAPSTRQRELAAMLWNLHSFYALFSDAVKSKISELRLPVEKKIKGFVKIARWNDISFWAVKEAVHKTHQTLHKQIREYEKILNQPSRPALMASTSDSFVDQVRKTNVTHDPTAFIAKSAVKQLIPADLQDAVSIGSILHSPASLFGRARTLTKQAIFAWTCPELIRSLDAFAGEIASTAQHLSSLQVDRTLERKKQVSHAKNIVQMKRKALADLFKDLVNIGLSYRTGLGFEESDTVFRYSLLPPLDLEVAFKNCVPSSLPSKIADESVISAGDGAENYITRSLARRVHLSSALRQPHSDVGPTLIQRLRGFASHLMELNHQQKQSLVEGTKQLLQSRVLISQLAGLTKPVGLSQKNLCVLRDKLSQALQTAAFTLRQFLVFLQACPESAEQLTTLEITSESSPITYAVLGDSNWANINAQVNSLLCRIGNLRKDLDKFKHGAAFEVKRIVTEQECSAIRHTFNQAGATVEELNKICSFFGSNPAVRSLESLQEHILSLVNEFQQFTTADSALFTELESQRNDVSISCDPLLRLVLLVVQDIVKKRKQDVSEDIENTDVEAQPQENIPNGVEENDDEVSDYKLVNKHLTEAIISGLEGNCAELRMADVCREVQRLLTKLTAKEVMVSQESLNQVAACLPLLHQWALLCQSVVQQQAAALRASAKLQSVILSVFINVAQKGFCMPEDLKGDEQNDEEGEDNKAGGMGLGDGEGEKDVSEKIESEDQLEGAYKEGEEKKEEDKDCKEEENAIEMSDDFEGKHQDVEPKEGSDDEEDEKEDDVDPEKEMGDTGEAAEELDEQIWGSDPEDEEDEDLEGDDKRESGEQMGDKELGASEDQNKNKGEEDEEDESRPQDDKKKEINEMQEPEVDDDHVDPYHGKQKPEDEPEPMDLPDDMQMDEGDKDEGENETENPFDIDAMKDELPPEPENVDETADESKEENKDDDNGDDSEGEEGGEGAEKENAEPTDEEKAEEETQREEGGSKDEEKGGDDPTKEEEQEEDIKKAEEAKPSADESSAEAAEKAERMDSGSKDQVDTQKQETADIEPEEERDDSGDPGKDEQKGVGQADTSEVQQGHQNDQSGKQPRPDRTREELSDQKKKQKPGHSNEKRTLGQLDEPVRKKLKTIDSKDQKEENAGEEDEEEAAIGRDDADMYEHIQEAKDEGDTQTLDTATKEQAEQQSRIAKEEEEASAADEEVPMDVDNDEDDLVGDQPEKQKAEQVTESKKKEKSQKPPSGEERLEKEINHEVEGDTVETSGVARGPETTFHTRFDELSIRPVVDVERDMQTIRTEIQNQMATWRQAPIGPEAEKTWQTMSSVVGSLAHDLCEQLRLIMEPTQASRLRGDFRTGRRLNMRKVIPYIASQYRKDKIWLRRTKPSKREYQIVLAIDDSSSMADNQSKELAFESVALVSKALTLLEAGELGVLSFGETARLVHRLGEPFTQHSGGRLLQEFTFEQRRTQVAALLNFATEMLSSSRSSVSSEHAQLLVIVSDGRGIFSEGKEVVKAAVQRTRQAGVFVLFLVIDNPKNKDSIFDIRVPEFVGGKLTGITPYMDSFPFPFYLILQDLASLPRVLSDALRQWFELVTKS